MTSLGSLLWIVAIGAVFFMMTRKGGGCCGGGHDKGHGSPDHSQGNDENQPRGGCCG